jgi:hypothetical protein
VPRGDGEDQGPFRRFWCGGGHHLTQLHADALITLDRQLADAVKDLVTVAPIEALY